MDQKEAARALIEAPYAVRADGTVLSVEGDCGWIGVRKTAGDTALRWDGRLLHREQDENRHWALKDTARWRHVRDADSSMATLAVLMEDGSLCWMNNLRLFHDQRLGEMALGWTDVERITAVWDQDQWDDDRGIYAVGFRADGTVRVAQLDNYANRSREIESFLNGLGPIAAVSRDCRVLLKNGRVYSFSAKSIGQQEKGLFADFDVPAELGAVMAAGGCLLMPDGTVKVQEGRYEGAEQWHDIIAISAGWLTVGTGVHYVMALRADGRVFLAPKYHLSSEIERLPDTSDWKLFESLDTLPAELEETRFRTLEEGPLLDAAEQEQKRREELEKLTRRRDECREGMERARKELSELKGYFTKKRRTQLLERIVWAEERLRELEAELKKLS